MCLISPRLQGTLLGPLISSAISLHPAVLVAALLGTMVVFACFSAAALLTPRRSHLYLGGYLSSALTLLLCMRLGSWMFGGRSLVYEGELYIGLLVFAAYVLFDTQVIVEKAHQGDKDHIKHALDLFVDLVAMFARVLIIMLRNAERREKEKKRKTR